MKLCRCVGHRPFRLEGEVILCRKCDGLYRPFHPTHTGDGTPDHCPYCQDYLRTHAATEEARKV